jgi:hypothetical protein
LLQRLALREKEKASNLALSSIDLYRNSLSRICPIIPDIKLGARCTYTRPIILSVNHQLEDNSQPRTSEAKNFDVSMMLM